MSESLEGKVAVISGVASGFAKATAELFAEKGCGLVLFDLNEAGLKATAEKCRAFGAKVRQLKMVLMRLRSRIFWFMASSISSMGATLSAPPA